MEHPGRADLTTSERAEAIFSSMGDDTFWSYKHERDLLYAIRDRWAELSDAGRRSIEARLLASPVPYLKDHDPQEAEEMIAVHRLNAIHWFSVHGIAFGFDLTAEKARLPELAPIWREECAGETAQPNVHGPYSVVTDTDATSILDVPPDELLPIEVPKRGFRDTVEHNPFTGYSAAKPEQAVQALRSAMRRNVDTAWFSWSTFFRSTSELETSAELDSEVVSLIVSLSPEDIAKLWYPLVEWFSHRAMKFEQRGHGEFDLIWDKVIAVAGLHPSGYKQKPSRDWSFEALNSIVGRLVLALLEMKLPPEQKGVPTVWVSRLKKALELPGDHARHALHLIAAQSRWFHYHEPAWWDAHLLSPSSRARW